MKNLRQAIAERGEFVMNAVKRKHEQKLQKDQKRNYGQIKKKWVVNISDRALNNNEISVLRKGLNFAITPKQIPTKEILASVESAISNLQRDQQDEVRNEVFCTLRQAKPPTEQNLTQDEKEALKDLSSDDEILVIKADKGSCTVVMNKVDYQD